MGDDRFDSCDRVPHRGRWSVVVREKADHRLITNHQSSSHSTYWASFGSLLTREAQRSANPFANQSVSTRRQW